MESPSIHVLIAGGGVAGLETLLGLHRLAGDRVALTLVAPDGEFVYRPLTTERPFSVGRMRRVALSRAAEGAGASFLSAVIEEVDADGRTVSLSTGERMSYDALVLAVGADVMPVLDHVMTWDDRSDSEMLGGVLQDIEQGYAERLAVVIPPGPGWPLRGYELALVIAHDAYGMSVDVEITIVRPDPPPLALLGDRAVALVAGELERAGIAAVSAEQISIEPGTQATLILHPSGERLEVNRVVAMPILRGRTIGGVPADEYGLIEVDERCRVAGLEGVWAVGDCTAFPLKSGGISAEQADVVAEDIAAIAGAPVRPREFDPTRGELAGLPAGRFLEERLEAQEPGLSMHLPTTGVPVLTYLQKDFAAGWRDNG
ncbi:MAG TPA: FAD-dependent oxidoreductase [Solirubrobacteraceae bacterium]